MDISKLAERLADTADGGVSRKLAMLEGHSALSMATKSIEREWAALRSAGEMARLNNFAMGRSALDEAISRQSGLYRELTSASAAHRWHTSAEAAARNIGVVERFALHGSVFALGEQARAMMERTAWSAASVAESAARMSAVDAVAKSLANAVSPFAGGTFATASAWEARLSVQMKAFEQPWMLPDDPARSMLGFARLSRLSDTLRYSPPYSRDLNRFISEELGEFIEHDSDASPEERDEAAVDAGMRAELIAFPQTAFRLVVGTAGFTLDLPPLPIPQPLEGDNPGASFDPVVKAILCQVETRLRLLVIERLTREAGHRWLKTRVPSQVLERWAERQAEARDKGRPVLEEIYYADIMDLEAVICRRDNWQAGFADIFGNKHHFSLSLQHIAPIRNDDAHHRPIGSADMLRLLTEATHILKALGVNILH